MAPNDVMIKKKKITEEGTTASFTPPPQEAPDRMTCGAHVSTQNVNDAHARYRYTVAKGYGRVRTTQVSHHDCPGLMMV